MKSIRLNTEIREAILKNIADAYDTANPAPKLTIDTQGILENAVRKHYQKQALELHTLVDANPVLHGSLATRTNIRYVSPNGNWGILYAEENETFFYKFAEQARDFNNQEYLAKNPTLKKAAEKFISLQKAARKEREALSTWEKERNNYLDEIRQVLKGVSTTKQLLEQWAEVKEYIPQAYFNPSKIALPAINTSALNAKLKK